MITKSTWLAYVYRLCVGDATYWWYLRVIELFMLYIKGMN